MRSESRRRLRRTAGLAAAMLAAGGIGTGPLAHGDDDVSITSKPVIAGAAELGGHLEATAGWAPASAKAKWQWMRCGSTDLDSCRKIDDADAAAYDIRGADRGDRLRAALEVKGKGGDDIVLATASAADAPDRAAAVSAPTAVIRAAEAKPKPTPDPTPEPTPGPVSTPEPTPTPRPKPKPKPTPTPEPAETPEPEATPTPAPPGTPFDPPATAPAPAPAPAPTGGVAGTSQRRVPPLKPFPSVRLQGRLTERGARITRFVVRGPRRAHVRVTCAGTGCPARRYAGQGRLLRVTRMQGAMPRGTRLLVLVTRRGYIGKRTDILIRLGRAPLRRDRCVSGATGRRIVRCPR